MKLHIPFRVWESANIARATDDVRHYLNGVHIKNDRVESTNGHVAYIARMKGLVVPEFFSDIEKPTVGVIVSPKNKIPKWSKKNPVDSVILTINEKDVSIDYFNFYGERISSDVGELVDGNFPNIPKLISGIRKNKINQGAKVGFKTEYLGMPHKMLSHCKWPMIELELFNGHTAAIFKLKREGAFDIKETLVVMPARLS